MHALACVLQLKTGNGLRTVASAAVFFLLLSAPALTFFFSSANLCSLGASKPSLLSI
jgi:hypothetical protein